MRRTITAGLAASLAVVGGMIANGAQAQAPALSQVCSPTVNGGMLVKGVCVLPATTTGGGGYDEFLIATNNESDGGTDVFSIASGSLPPGMNLADHIGATSTVIYDTATRTGTFTFVVKAADPDEGLSSLQTYSIKVSTPPLDRLVCSPDSNGGELVEGVCVLPGTNVGQPYEGFIQTSNNAGGVFSITVGSLPPGLSMPARYGAAGTIVAGTPSRQGKFTFTVEGTDQEGQRMRQTYSITVGPPLPLTVTFPTSCCTPGKVGKAYLQNIAVSGGVGPYKASIASGKVPPGLKLATSPPFSITGTPTTAGLYKFTIRVTDGRGIRASKPGTIKVS